jgi:ribosome maturation protein SDO1
LLKGEIQVSAKERDSQSESLLKEIATIVAEKCVNPATKLPYPVAVIEKAIKDSHFSPHLGKNAKQQALEVIKTLEKDQSFPISRAQMRLLIHTAISDASRVLPAITPLISAVEEESKESGELNMTVLVYPGAFREITEIVAKLTRGKGTVHTLNLKVLQETEDL